MNTENTENLAEPGQVLDYEAILAEYRHRQMLEHLTGPVVSLILHVVLIVAAVLFLVGQPQAHSPPIEVTITELELKELDPELQKELEKLDELEPVVPTVAPPDLSSDVAEVEMSSSDDFASEMLAMDDAIDLTGALDIRASTTPLVTSQIYSSRISGEARERARRQFRGSPAAERAVIRALNWLKKTQNPNGSWSRSQPDAMAGLALLTFLAHGETPLSEDYGRTVQSAIQYLVNRMMSFSGAAGVGGRAYTHGIVTYALAEAYGMTQIPFIKPAMERGLQHLIDGQQRAGGYDYRYAKGQRWDLSVASWQFQSMKAGSICGANVEGMQQAMDRGIDWLKNTVYKDARFGYSSPGSGSWGMTGAGALCLQLLGEGHASQTRAAVANIVDNYKVEWNTTASYNSHSNPFYHWYYMTQAAFHGGTSSWRKWNSMFSDLIVANQLTDEDDPDCGYWICPGHPELTNRPEYDPWYSTTLAALSLQVYYRYLPTYQAPQATVRSTSSPLDILGDDLNLQIR